MKWLITGDTHGQVMTRLSLLNRDEYPPQNTSIIILGDAGINFYLNKTDIKNKKIINNTGYIIYCVRGNHEERPENISTMERWYDTEIDGTVWREPQFPNIRYFMDGHAYLINGKSTLVIGGAYSVDKWYRLTRAGVTGKLHPDYTNSKKTGWFPDELLTSEEMGQIELNINGNSYDVILTHTCPESWEPRDLFLSGLDQSTVDKSMEKWLDVIKTQIDWKIWLFGHYHDDRLVRPGVEMFYHDIEELDTVFDRWTSGKELDWWLKKDPNYDADIVKKEES